MSDERIAITIDTMARLEGVKAAHAGVKGLGGAAEELTARSQAAGGAISLLASKGQQLKQGAAAMSQLSIAAQQATLGGQSATMAFGNLAMALSNVAAAGKFAGMASGIGAVVIVASTLLTVLQKMNAELELSKEKQKELGRMALDAARTRVTELNRQISALQATAVPDPSEKFGKVQGRPFGDAPVLSRETSIALREALAERKLLTERTLELEEQYADAVTKSSRALLESGAQQSFEVNQRLTAERLALAVAHDGQVTASETLALKKQEAEQQFASTERQIRQQYLMKQQEGESMFMLQDRVNKGHELIDQARDLLTVTTTRLEIEKQLTDAAVKQTQLAAEAAAGVRARIAGVGPRVPGAPSSPAQDDADRIAAEMRRQSIGAIRLETREVEAGNVKDPRERLEAEHRLRLEMIEQERLANIKLYEDQAAANANAQAKIIAAEQDRAAKIKVLEGGLFATRAAGYARSLGAANVFGAGVSKIFAGVQAAIAMYEQLPQSKLDYQKGMSQAAAATASAASGNFAGAAGHGAAAAAYFSAAAFGMAAAGAGAMGGMGGGGGGGGGGGYRGGETMSPEFRPAGGQGGTVVNIELYTMNPYGREAIQNVLFEIDRAEVTKVPIRVPPTNGFIANGTIGGGQHVTRTQGGQTSSGFER